MAHIQGPLQIKPSEHAKREDGSAVNLFRVSCSCGAFRGAWYSEPKHAFTSHARHSNGEGVVFAERVAR